VGSAGTGTGRATRKGHHFGAVFPLFFLVTNPVRDIDLILLGISGIGRDGLLLWDPDDLRRSKDHTGIDADGNNPLRLGCWISGNPKAIVEAIPLGAILTAPADRSGAKGGGRRDPNPGQYY
jgi:hypothetical protein